MDFVAYHLPGFVEEFQSGLLESGRSLACGMSRHLHVVRASLLSSPRRCHFRVPSDVMLWLDLQDGLD